MVGERIALETQKQSCFSKDQSQIVHCRGHADQAPEARHEFKNVRAQGSTLRSSGVLLATAGPVIALPVLVPGEGFSSRHPAGCVAKVSYHFGEPIRNGLFRTDCPYIDENLLIAVDKRSKYTMHQLTK